MPDIAEYQGETLKEWLSRNNILKESVAEYCGQPVELIRAIIEGEKFIRQETALQLEKFVGWPLAVWDAKTAEWAGAPGRWNRPEPAQKEATIRSVPDTSDTYDVIHKDMILGSMSTNENTGKWLFVLKGTSYQGREARHHWHYQSLDYELKNKCQEALIGMLRYRGWYVS